PAPTPTATTESAVLPSADAVVDGRFVVPVQLDDGTLRVDPLPDDTIPDGAARAADLLWASRLFSTKDAGVIGYGLITLEGGQDGKAAVDQVPGWIAFGWGGVTWCPDMTAPPSPTDLPSNGYVAVAILPNDQFSDFSYEARAQVCDAPVHGPVIGMATHVESIPWTQDSPAGADGVRITYTPAPCGSHETFNASEGSSGTTLSVEMSVPDAALPCAPPAPLSETLTGPGYGTGSLEHGDLGLVRQANFAT
ncbi:MAG: hypothetical protein M3O29_04545, partial [Actinomycetota bacterium]|nr:hypothetical protein [Actinomycetota bacterium]